MRRYLPRVRRAPLLALLLAAAGCRATPPRDGGEGLGVPAEGLPADVAAAERAIREGKPDLAERILESAGGIDASAPERSWLLAGLWSSRAALAKARVEAERLPPRGFGAVLRAHLANDSREREAAVLRETRGRAAGWAHLEMALVLAEEGDREAAARSHAARAAAIGPAFVRREALLLSAQQALEQKRAPEGLALARAAAIVDPTDSRPPSTASRLAARLGRRSEATIDALEAHRLQPASLRAARRLADLVRDDPGEEAERSVRTGLRGIAVSAGGNSERAALDGLLAERAGDRETAIAAYRRALDDGAEPVPVDRHLRHLLFAAGRYGEALALLRGAVPPASVARRGNVRAGAWAALDAAAQGVAAAGEPSPASRRRLAVALDGVGAVEDAAIVVSGLDDPESRALGARLDAVVAFERAFRSALEEGYRAPASGAEAPPLESLLDRLGALARSHLPPEDHGSFASPRTGLRNAPLLGRWLDHSVATTSPIVAWFRRHGQHLVIGQREGNPPEAVLLSLAALVPGAEIHTHGRAYRHDLAVGYDRVVRPFLDFQGGGLSGAALPDGVWLDADASRREAATLRLARRADATLVARVREAGASPPAPDGPDGVFALDDTAGLALRLSLDELAATGGDPWACFAVLEAHESGHVFDLDRHLPVAKGLPATIGLLARAGFSLDVAEARLEGRAQLSSLVESGRPRLALLDLVRPLPLLERSPEAHDRGYRDVVARLLRRLYAESARHPRIDPTKKLLPQLDRLSAAELEALGRAIDEDR